MKIEPLDNRVLVLPDALEEKLGSIYVPDSVKDSQPKRKGTVIACGKGHVAEQTGEFTPITVKEGDRISYPAHVGEKFEGDFLGLDEGEYLLMREWDIDFIIEVPIDYSWIDRYLPKKKEGTELKKDL